jgi:HEPN domain-containing protein
MKLGKTDESNPADWFAFAAERLLAADVLSRHDGTSASSVEALQEAAERYLKGFLIAKGWALKRTHDLKVLVKDAAVFAPEFSRFLDLADRLTAEFFEQHYPGGDLTHVGENYPGMRAEISEVIALIQRTLPAYFPDAQTGSETRSQCSPD